MENNEIMTNEEVMETRMGLRKRLLSDWCLLPAMWLVNTLSIRL